MGKFIVLSFMALGIVFYEMSGGSDFEPELRAPVDVAATTLAPAATPIAEPEVTRANTETLIQIAAPAQNTTATNQAFLVAAPSPAGEVIITPAPATTPADLVEVAAPVAEATLQDLRAVAGERVNMRSGPSTGFTVIDTLPRGTQTEVLEINADGWARIRITTTGQEGWMAERLLSSI